MANKIDLFKKNYVLELHDGASVHKGKGVTIYDAFKKIKPFSSKKLVGVRVIYDGKVSNIPIRLVPLKVKRLFGNDIEAQIFAKRLETLR